MEDGDHIKKAGSTQIKYGVVQSPCSTPETNATLCANYTSIKQKQEESKFSTKTDTREPNDSSTELWGVPALGSFQCFGNSDVAYSILGNVYMNWEGEDYF